MPNSRARSVFCSPAPARRRSSGRERFPASAVGPTGFGQSDPFPLAFTGQGPLELSERPHDGEHQVASGESSPAKTNCSLRNSIRTPFVVSLFTGTKVIQVPCEPVHAVHDQRVPVSDEAQQLRELGASGVLTRGIVLEDPVQLDALELALDVLVKAADPDVSDSLPPTAYQRRVSD